MDDYLAKPIHETELQRVLQRFLPAQSATLDAETVARLRGMGDGFFAEVANVYLQDAPARLAAIRAAAAANDARALAAAAHAFRSGSGNIGATEVHQLCSELEGMGNEGRLSGVSDTVTALEQAFARVEHELRGVR